ncbi:hypothetical protein FGG08_002836 [Glutinoglossum americanum]|uniref:Cytochrome b561 domain-containing protein n=1 Tax=Glutinoglossum americanum TaxID=1670608 RepID=A0A9P8I8V6_9PEZI|nr:hypothetical protein FGG08_002836 [Glutinoglossum americanum]
MVSATDTPEQRVAEDEPLLGRAGDVLQEEGKGIQFNLVIGTAVLAQAGIWILVAVIWTGIFTHDLITFSAHPLLNSAGILLLTQSILILQPTHTADQKRQGTAAHFTMIFFGASSLYTGLVVILYTKLAHHGTHFESPHAILGLVCYVFLLLQGAVGFTQYYTPRLYGGVDNAKKMYKFHRMSGYALLVLLLATVAAATKTDYIKGIIKIKLWAVLVPAVLVLLGVFPRIKKQKLGIRG